jgi:hypothetical protein
MITESINKWNINQFNFHRFEILLTVAAIIDFFHNLYTIFNFYNKARVITWENSI